MNFLFNSIFANEATDKGLIFKIYKELIQININKTTQSKNGRRPKQTFPQRRHTDGQQAQEKVFNIVNYQRNANKKNEISPCTIQNGYNKKNLQIINAADGVEKREPSYTVGRNVNWHNHDEEQYADSFKN